MEALIEQLLYAHRRTIMEQKLNWLYEKVKAAGKVSSCYAEYTTLTTDEERFLYALRLSQQYNVEPKIQMEQKNSSESESFRQQGNKLFLSKNSNDKLDEILELYNKSVAFADENSEELSYAYGNRSALLFKARLYDHCLRDIDRALVSDCPSNLKVKLSIRRAHCLMAIAGSERTNWNEKWRKKIDEAVAEAQQCVEKLIIDETLKSKFHDNLKNPKKNLMKRGQREMFDEEKYKPATPTDNPELPGVSGALKISYDEKFGRHVTATRKILPGEVLCVQRGYATILAPDLLYSYCSNCLRQTWSGVACERCVRAIYCDENCREEARMDYHDVECAVVGVMIKLEFNVADLMSLRLTVRAVKEAGGFGALKKKLEDIELSSDPRTKGFVGTPPILDETDYASVYTLATNTEKRTVPDLFGVSLNSVFMVLCVATLTEFLGEKLPPDFRAIEKNRWSGFLGGLVSRHRQIVATNGHMVGEMKDLDSRERGGSIIPFLSYFNHSCAGTVSRTHYGKYVVLNAIETIEAGQQVYDNYGMQYPLKLWFMRRRTLERHYFFTCQCRPCSENWPMLSDLRSCLEQSLDRGRMLKVRKTLKTLARYAEISKKSEIADKLHIVRDTELILKMLYENINLPCLEVEIAIETLDRMYMLLSNRFQSICDKKKKVL